MKSEYSCRRIEPDKFDSLGVRDGKFFSMYRTSRKYGKPYRVIIGRLKRSGKYADEAYRYKKENWLFRQAKSHCKEHEGIKFEEQTFNDVTGNPFQTPEDKLRELIQFNRSGRIVSDLKLTKNNLALIAVELELFLNKLYIDLGFPDTSFYTDVVMRGVEIDPNAVAPPWVVLKDPIISLSVRRNVPNFLPCRLAKIEFNPSPLIEFSNIPVYARYCLNRMDGEGNRSENLHPDALVKIIFNILNNAVPEGWYLAVDL